MSRFFVNKDNVKNSSIFITDKDDIKHITKVLRLDIGDLIDISDSIEFEYETEIISIDRDYIEVKVLNKKKFTREPQTKITLFQGIPKQGKMETIIQKSVELGVNAIVPIFTERTVVTDKGNFKSKVERWQKIADESVKQCKRGIIPKINQSSTLMEIMKEIGQYELVLFPYENEEAFTIKDCLRNLDVKPQRIAIIIGPEGGFSDKEAEMIKNAGAKCVTLGKTILRTETAGIVTIAMVMYELEL